MKMNNNNSRNFIFMFIALALFMAMVPMTSAATWDNIKHYDKDTETITIKNTLGLGKTLATHTLTDNTYQCLTDCYAEGTTELMEDADLTMGLERVYG